MMLGIFKAIQGVVDTCALMPSPFALTVELLSGPQNS